MSGGKGEIEEKLEQFVNKAYEESGLNPSDIMSKDRARKFFK